MTAGFLFPVITIVFVEHVTCRIVEQFFSGQRKVDVCESRMLHFQKLPWMLKGLSILKESLVILANNFKRSEKETSKARNCLDGLEVCL